MWLVSKVPPSREQSPTGTGAIGSGLRLVSKVPPWSFAPIVSEVPPLSTGRVELVIVSEVPPLADLRLRAKAPPISSGLSRRRGAATPYAQSVAFDPRLIFDGASGCL